MDLFSLQKLWIVQTFTDKLQALTSIAVYFAEKHSSPKLNFATLREWVRIPSGGPSLNRFVLVCLALSLCPGLFAQTPQSCPSGTEDMMNYFVMGYPNRLTNYVGPGNANPIYTSITPDLGAAFATSGQFEWIKSSAGYPWDVKVFDSNYIYDRTTELSWTDPTAFKRFDVDLPMSKRCVPLGNSSTIKIPSSGTNFSSYASCSPTQTQNLGYVVNTISSAYKVTTGNLGTVKTRYFTYKYSCNSNYDSCKYKEVFSLGYHVGLYDWKYYVNNGSGFVFVQESVINQFDPGSATPYLPCTTSYQ